MFQHRPNLKRWVQALTAALLFFTPGIDAAQLPLADGELPLQLVYPEGAIPPPGEPRSILLHPTVGCRTVFRLYRQDYLEGC